MARNNLESELLIDKDALDEAVIKQPDLFYRVAERLALLISQRDAMKTELEEIEADATTQYNASALRSNERVTVKAIEAMVTLDPKVREAKERYNGLSSDVMQAQALKEAFQQRSYALNHLVDLYMGNYFGGKSSRAPAAEEREAQRTRERMSDMRTSHRKGK